MTLNEFAKQELELAGLLSPEQDFYGGETGKAVLELIDVFSKQGHSGSGQSATIVADVFWKLANFKSLTPITGTADEWREFEPGVFQNKRCLSLIKKNGECVFGNAIVFVDPNGASWTGSCWLTEADCLTGDKRRMLKSAQKIKGFPFTPKVFRIDVKHVEIGDEVQPVVKHLGHLEEAKQWYLFE